MDLAPAEQLLYHLVHCPFSDFLPQIVTCLIMRYEMKANVSELRSALTAAKGFSEALCQSQSLHYLIKRVSCLLVFLNKWLFFFFLSLKDLHLFFDVLFSISAHLSFFFGFLHPYTIFHLSPLSISLSVFLSCSGYFFSFSQVLEIGNFMNGTTTPGGRGAVTAFDLAGNSSSSVWGI